ncbi:MAG: hypothetical protein GYA63_09340 [Armatimonadetes bacterium]|nr:hypothetical protein [Armatimonadota bacterium]
MRRIVLVILAFFLPAFPVSARSGPAAYIPVDQLRDEFAGFTLNPWMFRQKGDVKPPVPPPNSPLPPQPWLSLALPYSIDTSPVAFPTVETTPAQAADWRHISFITTPAQVWESMAEEDPVALRKRYRTDTGRDWPTTAETGPRGDASRLSVARWARQQTATRILDAAVAFRKSSGAKGPLAVAGPQNAWTTTIPANAPVNHPGIILNPRVTTDTRVTALSAEFLVRLTSDLTQRIPFVSLDLSNLTKAQSGWAAEWINGIARQGVIGLHVIPAEEAAVRAETETALKPLRTAGVYLPPVSQVGILVSLDTCDMEPGAWLALFDAFSALRENGCLPGFVSDAQILNRSTQLARYRVLVVPAARWIDRGVVDAVEDWVRRGGTLIVCDDHAFSRDRDGTDTTRRSRSLFGWASVSLPPEDALNEAGRLRIVPVATTKVMQRWTDGRPAVWALSLGAGTIFTAPVNITSRGCPWPEFWKTTLKTAGTADHSGYSRLSTKDIARITGAAPPRK